MEIDLRPAVTMLEKGHGLGVTVKAMGVARSTLRRRLMEAGGASLPDAKFFGMDLWRL